MEIIENWEWVIKGSDLVNGTIRLEDAETSCAIIREIGTDNPTTITFGVEDTVYIRINKLIAPYYKASYNLNSMKFSQVRDGKWVSTGFELPVPIDNDIFIDGLGSDNRVYLKGTLFKGVLRADDPINQYLRARKAEVPWKNLHPLLYENVTIPDTFKANSKFILRTDNVPSPVMEPWDSTSPHYTIVPEKGTKYVLNNPIEVLWNHPELEPQDVEFRIWYDGAEDLKVRPRLDHMLLPPSDGKSKWIEESILIPAAQVKSYTTNADVTAGSNVTVTVGASVDTTQFAPGMNVLVTDGTNYDIAKIVDITETESGAGAGDAGFTLDKLAHNYAAGATVAAPATKLSYQPLAPVDVITNSGGGVCVVYTPTAEVFTTAGNDTTAFEFGYYAYVASGGKDIFSMRTLAAKYRILEDPHKLTFMFVNKGSDVTTTGTMTLYTLTQFFRSAPPEIAAAVQRTLQAAQAAGYPV